MIDRVTPVILTHNEAPNIDRVLARLDWSKDIVVVDSGSTDGTLEILRAHSKVRVFTRRFDSHASQWEYAIRQTGIRTDWVLALDADYVLEKDFETELAKLDPSPEVAGYRTRFRYCVFGRPLRSTVYPPVTTLFRVSMGKYEQDGHTQRWVTSGRLDEFPALIRHDDRKPLSGWLASQDRYMRLETEKLLASSSSLGMTDKVRLWRWAMPAAMFLYCLFVKGLIFDGYAGLFYSFQRSIAEAILSLHLLREGLEHPRDGRR